MAIDPDKLLGWKFPDIEHAYSDKDTMLYALGVGCGSDPDDGGDLQFVYERRLVALPTMAVVLAYPGNWLATSASTIDFSRVLHGEQTLTLYRPLAPTGTVIGRTRNIALLDKGREKGAVLLTERTLSDKASGEKIATLVATTMLRGDGGFGGNSGPQPAPHVLPDTPPASHVDLRIPANAALIYRLSGDRNPLHADPEAAASGGFARPILHGLCTYGVAARAIIKACCAGDASRLRGLNVRFSAPVYPGETLRTEMWGTGGDVSFRARVVERDVIVLGNGLARVA